MLLILAIKFCLQLQRKGHALRSDQQTNNSLNIFPAIDFVKSPVFKVFFPDIIGICADSMSLTGGSLVGCVEDALGDASPISYVGEDAFNGYDIVVHLNV